MMFEENSAQTLPHLMEIRVALVEDNENYMSALSQVLERVADINVVAKFTTIADTIVHLVEMDVDLALVDLGLPDGSGVEVVRQLRRQTAIKSLVLTVYDDDEHLFQALTAGAIGYILKDKIAGSKLVESIREVFAGGAPMSPGVACRVLNRFYSEELLSLQADPLTRREREVLQLLAKGYTAKQVARDLGVSFNTIRCHRQNIYEKLQVSSVVAAVSVMKNNFVA